MVSGLSIYQQITEGLEKVKWQKSGGRMGLTARYSCLVAWFRVIAGPQRFLGASNMIA